MRAFLRGKILWPALAVAVVLYYARPLFDPNTSVQWDAVDFHYPAQKYLADSLRHGPPFWTPFEYSGMPFLADPQVAAWYPLHWPFFLVGITPKAIEWELALHAFLALGGTYLLARRLTGNASAGLLAGALYAGGGFFSGHSSHLGTFETAALAPWLLWAADRALESATVGPLFLSGVIGALVILAGHFQTTLYAFCALILFLSIRRVSWRRAVAVVAGTAVVATLLSAIEIMPGFELAAQSVRAGVTFRDAASGSLVPGALATLLFPDHYGVLSGAYHGPPDITQYYFYQGVLLVPLALFAMMRRGGWQLPLALVALPMWYALGPGTVLFTGLAHLPGFANIRAPVQIWFVVALGLSLAAAQGALWIAERTRAPWLITVLVVVCVLDVWHFNMSTNPLAYLRTSFQTAYGDASDRYLAALAGIKDQPFSRIWSPVLSNDLGPLNGALETRTEVAYGYNPLELQRYAAYVLAADTNPRLLNGLAVTHALNLQEGRIVTNPDALPRVSASPRAMFVADASAAWSMLPTLDPKEMAIVEGPSVPTSCGAARIQVLNYQAASYRVHYNTTGACLLRFAVPYFPGWSASIDGLALTVHPTDYALIGVVVPAGDHEMTLRYRSTWFSLGALVSGLTVAGLVGVLLLSRRTSSASA